MVAGGIRGASSRLSRPPPPSSATIEQIHIPTLRRGIGRQDQSAQPLIQQSSREVRVKADVDLPLSPAPAS